MPIDRVLLALLAIAFLARLGVLWELHDHPLLRPSPQLDTGVYLDLARRVAGGDLLGGDRVFFVSPFYIYFMAVGLLVSGGAPFAIQIVQAVLGTAAVWFVADTARLWFGRRAGWVAAGVAALTGYFAFNESLLLQSAVDPVLTAFGLWALSRAWTSGRVQMFALAGVALGLHALNRPNVLAWAAAALALTAGMALLRARRGTAKDGSPAAGWMAPAALVAGLAIVLAPVALRNYAVAGQLALVSSHGGLNFFIGNNARADGTYRLVPGITPSISGQDRDMRQVAGQALGRSVTDVEASSWFYAQAREWIGANPAAAAALFARKLAYVFNAEDIPLNDSFSYYRMDESVVLRALLVGPWLLLPLGLAGTWYGRKTEAGAAAWWAWVAFVPVYALSVAIFFVTGRYRLPLLVALCVTGAAPVLALFDGVRAAGWRALAGGTGGRLVAALALLGVTTNWNLGIDNGLAGWRSEMVLYHVQAGHDEAARELLARTEPIYPNPGLLLYRVGRAYLGRGDARQAAALFERGLKVAPERAELRLALGETFLQLGRDEEAITLLDAARRTPAVAERATLALARALVGKGRAAEGAALLRSRQASGRLDPAALLGAGQAALEQGEPAAAEPFLREAVQAAPGNAAAHEALGLALAMQGQRAEAAGVLEQACRLDPGSASSRLNLAILYAEMGREADARRAAEEALRLRPGYERAREFLLALGRPR